MRIKASKQIELADRAPLVPCAYGKHEQEENMVNFADKVDETFGHVQNEKMREFLTRPEPFGASLDECGEMLDMCEQFLANDEHNPDVTPTMMSARQEAIDEMHRSLGMRNSVEFRSACRDFWLR